VLIKASQFLTEQSMILALNEQLFALLVLLFSTLLLKVAQLIFLFTTQSFQLLQYADPFISFKIGRLWIFDLQIKIFLQL